MVKVLLTEHVRDNMREERIKKYGYYSDEEEEDFYVEGSGSELTDKFWVRLHGYTNKR